MTFEKMSIFSKLYLLLIIYTPLKRDSVQESLLFCNYSEPHPIRSQNQPAKLPVALRALCSAHVWGGGSIQIRLD
jgi:hypothetical protein